MQVHDSSSRKDVIVMGKARAKAKQVKGKIKESAGDALDDKRMEAEGAAERMTGKAQEMVARAADDLQKSKR
ncbi:CsbD family protein [Streptomyces sp. 5.8]|uniref:CsbD family protein n=1 Tax=Streptomyces sp. 5.8 TaxID=3406571 RepID=UPI003BB6D375